MSLPSLPDFAAWTPADWSALGTGVTALTAVIAAIFAYRQVREARRLREEQAQPFVVVDFELSPVSNLFINLIVENTGKTLATNVKLTFVPKLESARVKDDSDLNKSSLLQEGIPTLPPGKRIVALFDRTDQRINAKLPLVYHAKVEFNDSRDRKQKPLHYVLDLRTYYGLLNVQQFGLHDAAKALDEIQKLLKKCLVRGNGLRVWTRDEQAHDDQIEALYGNGFLPEERSEDPPSSS